MRSAVLGAVAVIFAGAACGPARAPASSSAAASPVIVAAPAHADAVRRLAEIERRAGGRIGLSALDTGTGERLGYRAAERFAMCSTFKLPLAAAVLARVDRGQEALDRVVRYGKPELLEYAPVTRAHVAEGGMRVGALCAAAIELSDNTAANLLLREIGGPPAVTAYLRSLGDATTRLDRTETALNENAPGDERDTTTPAAMLATMEKLLVGSALSASSRAQLEAWLVASETGAARLRAGLPPSWRVGDKTGSGEHGAANDVAIASPPGRAPILVVAYTTGSSGSGAERSAVLAEMAKVVAAELGAGR